jgi:flavin reductase (DIM6/NTAB) family NADH-FMN oxidoreductase RutF
MKPEMRPVEENMHRILTPRLVVTIGTVNESGRPNIIPINNITSVGVRPGMVLIAVYKPWITASNLKTALGFTVSVPQHSQLPLIWKLGQKYSGYKSGKDKIEEFKENLDLEFSKYGPVLIGAQGWLECEIIDRPNEAGADHYIVVGKYTKAVANTAFFDQDVSPINNPKPFMQWNSNNFSEASDVFSIDFYKDADLG